jgi:hypothetical protein
MSARRRHDEEGYAPVNTDTTPVAFKHFTGDGVDPGILGKPSVAKTSHDTFALLRPQREATPPGLVRQAHPGSSDKLLGSSDKLLDKIPSLRAKPEQAHLKVAFETYHG